MLFAIKIDAGGELVWKRRFPYAEMSSEAEWGCGTAAYSLVAIPEDGGFVIGGTLRAGYGCLEDSHPFVMRIDADGNSIWQINPAADSDYSYESAYVDLGREDRLIVRSTMLQGAEIWEFDLLGNEVKSHYFDNTVLQRIQGPILNADQGYFCLAKRNKPEAVYQNGSPAILRLNNDLEVMWIRNATYFDDGMFLYATDLSYTPDGGLVLSGGPNGTVTSGTNTTYLYSWVAKFDTLAASCGWGLGSCDSIVYEYPISNFTGVPKVSLELHPVPARDMLNLSYDIGSTESPGLFQIYDLSGRSVHAETLSQVDHSICIDLSHLHPGMYYYTLSLREQITDKGKLVVAD